MPVGKLGAARGLLHFQIRLTLSASPCRATALSAARLRVRFDLEMDLGIWSFLLD
jgi:hypothetical protein